MACDLARPGPPVRPVGHGTRRADAASSGQRDDGTTDTIAQGEIIGAKDKPGHGLIGSCSVHVRGGMSGCCLMILFNHQCNIGLS
jgi:hypothetical protein